MSEEANKEDAEADSTDSKKSDAKDREEGTRKRKPGETVEERPPARAQPVPEKILPWSKSAIASLVQGILGFLLLFLGVGVILGISAVICGHTGVWTCREKNNPKRKRGRRSAVAGLVLGYLTVLGFPLFLVIAGGTGYFAYKEKIENHFTEKRTERSIDSIARLYLACEQFASQNGDAYPAEWDDLAGRYLTKGDLDELLRSSHPKGPEISFRLVPHERPPLPAILDSIIVIQEIAPGNVKKVAVVYADGVTGLLSNPDRAGEGE